MKHEGLIVGLLVVPVEAGTNVLSVSVSVSFELD